MVLGQHRTVNNLGCSKLQYCSILYSSYRATKCPTLWGARTNIVAIVAFMKYRFEHSEHCLLFVSKHQNHLLKTPLVISGSASSCVDIIYTHIHALVHTYLHTYLPTYLPTYIHTVTNIHACIHAFLRTYLHAHIHIYRYREEYAYFGLTGLPYWLELLCLTTFMDRFRII